jgi:hypothetical protein
VLSKQRERGVPIIQNFGFMWERSEVAWGRPGPGGNARFEGRQVGNLKRVVDFQQQMGIYVLYDRFEPPVQVGQSNVIFTRLRQHRVDHLRNRWAYFTWFGFFKVNVRENTLLVNNRTKDLQRQIKLEAGLNEIEAVLIQVMDPRLNRRGSNWGDTEEYLQVREEDE